MVIPADNAEWQKHSDLAGTDRGRADRDRTDSGRMDAGPDLPHFNVDFVPLPNRPALAAQEKNCPSSPAYVAFIDTAAQNIYDPKVLGDVNALKHKFDCEIRNDADVVKYAEVAMRATGDRFNHALPPAETRAYLQRVNGGYTGIGVEIQPAADSERINAPAATIIKGTTPGRPAERAGFQPGDAIMKIDGRDVHNLNHLAITDLITAGQPGSTIDVVVDRKGRLVDTVVTREAIPVAPVVHDRDMGGGVTYIKIDSFGSGAQADELSAAMDRNSGARGFVLDLRDNGGGLVDQSLRSAQLFVREGLLMVQNQRHPSSPDRPSYDRTTVALTPNAMIRTTVNSLTGTSSVNAEARLPYKAAGRPVVVLTNGETASASETFTGAMRDSAHSTVIGTTTYGKGIGQTTFHKVAAGGALRVTSMRFETPSGIWVGDADKNRIGLKADIQVENPAGTVSGSPQDAQLNAALAVLRAKLPVRRN